MRERKKRHARRCADQGIGKRVRRIAQAGTTLILITHHVEEIIPEIARVVLLRAGHLAGAGTKEEMLAESRLSDVFGGPMRVGRENGYYTAVSR